MTKTIAAACIASLVSAACTPALRPEPGTPTATIEECESLDSSQQTWGDVSTVVLLIAGTLGVAGILIAKSDDAKIALFTPSAAGAYAGTLGYGQQKSKIREYRDKKCANPR